MRKFTLLCLVFVLPLGIMAQKLPLDFEVPEDDAFAPFNGATAAVVTDPTDGTNQVLELTSNGAPFDGASINMGTYIDLSDDSNNTITLEFWTPDATTRTHLLKVEGATNGPAAAELFFDTNAAGWQTVTLDFGPGLADDYIDDIDGPNGAVIPQDPEPSGPAPVPSVPDSEVYSIYNDVPGFSTNFPVQYPFGTLSGEPDLDASATENKALKFNFGVAGWGQGEGGPDDVSAYDFVSFDYWAGPTVVGFDFVLISDDGGVTEHKFQVSIDEPIVNEAWTKVEVPMSFFTNLGFSDTSLFQWKFSPLNDSVDNDGIVYIDNVLLTQNSLSNDSFEFANFNAYPNPTSDNWTINSQNENIKSVEIFNTLGRLVKSISVNDHNAQINATDLSSGIYFAKVSSDNNNVTTLKLIKK
jgi:hypothetical protein